MYGILYLSIVHTYSPHSLPVIPAQNKDVIKSKSKIIVAFPQYNQSQWMRNFIWANRIQRSNHFGGPTFTNFHSANYI